MGMGVFLSQRLHGNQTESSQSGVGTGPRMGGDWLRPVLPEAQQVWSLGQSLLTPGKEERGRSPH